MKKKKREPKKVFTKKEMQIIRGGTEDPGEVVDIPSGK